MGRSVEAATRRTVLSVPLVSEGIEYWVRQRTARSKDCCTRRPRMLKEGFVLRGMGERLLEGIYHETRDASSLGVASWHGHFHSLPWRYAQGQ